MRFGRSFTPFTLGISQVGLRQMDGYRPTRRQTQRALINYPSPHLYLSFFEPEGRKVKKRKDKDAERARFELAVPFGTEV